MISRKHLRPKRRRAAGFSVDEHLRTDRFRRDVDIRPVGHKLRLETLQFAGTCDFHVGGERLIPLRGDRDAMFAGRELEFAWRITELVAVDSVPEALLCPVAESLAMGPTSPAEDEQHATLIPAF